MENKIEMRMDSVAAPEVRYSNEGYFYDTPILTRTGIFEYTNPDGSIRRELRRPEDVFDPESLASYEGKPIIITHRAQEVNTENVHREEVGCILTPGWRDGDAVRAKIVLHNPDAVKASGYRELSLGYHLDLRKTPGELDGKAYDAIQTNIRINHLALVAAARAGDDTRLNMDGKETDGGKDSMDDVTKTTQTTQTDPGNQDAQTDDKVTGGAATNADDAGAAGAAGAPGAAAQGGQALSDEGLKAALKAYLEATAPAAANADGCGRKDSDGDAPGDGAENPLPGIVSRRDQMEDCQAKSDINTLLSLLEAATARADAAEEAAKSAAETDAMNHDGADDVDAKVRQRVELILLGNRLNLDGMDSLPVDEAKKKVIGAVLPGMRLDGKGSSYIEAAYDIAREKARARKTVDDQRQQLFHADSANAANRGKENKRNNPEDARNRMKKRHEGEEDN